MEKISDHFLKLHKFIVIFESSEPYEFWKIASLKTIAECANVILGKKHDPDLVAIFLKRGKSDLELIEVRFEALKTIHDFYVQAKFFGALFEKIEKLQESKDPSLKKIIGKDYQLQLLIEHVTLSIKLLRKYPFRAFLLDGEE